MQWRQCSVFLQRVDDSFDNIFLYFLHLAFNGVESAVDFVAGAKNEKNEKNERNEGNERNVSFGFLIPFLLSLFSFRILGIAGGFAVIWHSLVAVVVQDGLHFTDKALYFFM